VKDATLRPWRCDWLCGHLQMCGRTLPQTRQNLAKNRDWVFHPDLLIGLFEGNWDKVKEKVNEGGVHVDDVVALLECHAVGDFDVGTIVGAGASTVVGYIRNFVRKRVVRIGVCLAAGVVAVEGGIDGNVQKIHLFGDGGLVCLGTLSQVLKEIVEDKKVGGAQTQFGWCWEGKAHSGSRGFCIR
jgi:hypothetical protein